MTKKIKNKSVLAKFIDKRVNKIVDDRVAAILDPKIVNLVNSVDTSDNLTQQLKDHVDELESEFRHAVHELEDGIPDQYEYADLKDAIESVQYTVENEVLTEDNVNEIVDERVRSELDGHDIESLVSAASTIGEIRQAIESFGDSVKYL